MRAAATSAIRTFLLPAAAAVQMLLTCGCTGTLTEVDDPTVFSEVPLSVEEAAETWAGVWKFEGNRFYSMATLTLEVVEGEFSGTLKVSVFPEHKTYRVFDVQPFTGGKLLYTSQLVSSVDATNQNLVDAVINIASSTYEAASAPPIYSMLELNDDGTATLYEKQPETGKWLKIDPPYARN